MLLFLFLLLLFLLFFFFLLFLLLLLLLFHCLCTASPAANVISLPVYCLPRCQ